MNTIKGCSSAPRGLKVLPGRRARDRSGAVSMPSGTASNVSRERKTKSRAQTLGQARALGAGELELGSLDQFADACDRTRSAAAATRLLLLAARRQGFDKVIVLTHTQPAQSGSFSVRAHNCEPGAIEHFLSSTSGLLEAAEASNDLIFWDAREFRARLSPAQRAWFRRLGEWGVKNGVTQRIRTALVPASCSLTFAREDANEAAVRWMMRAGAYVFHHVIMLQRPQLAPSAVLTFREHQCLALASLAGLRPREVAKALGVSVNTVRSIRQRACARLGARSQEEAVWRMVETGQLFLPGRLSKPRSW